MLSTADLEKDILQVLGRGSVVETKVRSMFRMQNELNTLIDPTWYEGDKCDFNRASMIELGELMDHYGYKWWKKQEPDLMQSKLEVIDVAHFHISHLIKLALQEGLEFDAYVEDVVQGFTYFDPRKETPEGVRKIIDECIFLASSKNFSSQALGILMNAFDMSPELLCDHYITKNTLNIFRNKNGYKTGTYKKIWNGKEDNQVLMEVYDTIDKASPALADELYAKLDEVYKAVA